MKRTILLALFGIPVFAAFAQESATDEPPPGTREYYSKYVEGRYRYRNGEMVTASNMRSVPNAPGLVRGTSAPQLLKGTVLQTMETNVVLLGTSRRMPSGAERREHAVLQLQTLEGIAVGQEIATYAIQEGTYRCVFASGTTNTLTGYSVPQNTITFDEYLDVFQRDSQAAPIEPVLRIDRVAPASAASYAERLRQRREILRQRQAAGAASPILPVPLVPVPPVPVPPVPAVLHGAKEGLLPPTQAVQHNRANPTPESKGAETDPK